MALPKKKGFSIKFDLSLAGLLGVGVVCFCVFLWMFLLGVWAGQTGLISGMALISQNAVPAAAKVEAPKRPAPQEPVAATSPEPSPVITPAAPAPVPVASPIAVSSPLPVASSAPVVKAVVIAEPRAPAPEPPFYAIQVGAFRDSQNVEDELRLWRARGYEAFSRPPGENEHLTKVYIGHYPDAAGARKQEVVLAKKRKISPLIVMIRPD